MSKPPPDVSPDLASPAAVDSDSAAPGLSRQIAGSIIFLALALFAGLVLKLGGNLWLAQSLGPEIWGLYVMAGTVAIVAQIVFEKGAVAFLIQKAGPLLLEELGTAASIQLALGLLAFGITYFVWRPILLASLHDSRLDLLCAAASLATVAYSLRALPVTLLERRLAYGRVALIELADPILFYLTAALLILGGAVTEGLAAGMLLSAFGSLLFAFVFAGLPRFGWQIEASSRILAFGLPVLGTNISFVVNAWAEPVLLGLFVGSTAVALNQMTITILNVPAALALLLMRVSFSGMSRLQNDRVRLHNLVESNLSLVALVLVPATAAIAATGPVWVPFLLGIAWYPIILGLVIGAMPVAIMYTMILLFSPLNAVGRTRSVFVFSVLWGALYWLGIAVLIKPYTYLAPPLAMIGFMPCMLLLYFLYRHALGPLHVWRFLGLIGVSSLWMVGMWAASLSHAWWEFGLLGLAGGVTWMALFWHTYLRGAGWLQELIDQVKPMLHSAEIR